MQLFTRDGSLISLVDLTMCSSTISVSDFAAPRVRAIDDSNGLRIVTQLNSVPRTYKLG
jgi:hypothetical protein